MSAAGEQELLVEMRVADVRRGRAEDDHPRHYAAVLEEVGGSRCFAIWMGTFEGTAIALHLEHVEVPRPLTFSCAASVLAAAGGRLREVRIDRLVDQVFYATVVVEGAAGVRQVDARPSDALNLALLTGVPILVNPAVVAAAGSYSGSAADSGGDALEGATEIAAELVASWSGPAAGPASAR